MNACTCRRLAAALAAGVLAALLAPGAAGAAPRAKWLCHPAKASDPCRADLTATVLRSDGTTTIERSRVARRPRIDCFYVYPTVSGQPTLNADRRIDPEVRAIARIQASRFSQACRVFAPVYRQVTIKGLLDPAADQGAADRIAYSDVLAAWRAYLRRDNRGRGVVLIGHSQGTRMLTPLLRREIEPRRAVHRRLVSALLLGGNIFVSGTSGVRGDFARTPACRSARSTRCLVGYSAFDEAPPEDSVFGRVETALKRDGRPGQRVLCTAPGPRTGRPLRLHTYLPTTPFPGVLGPVAGDPPAAPTPWVSIPGRFSARCRHDGGADWLHVTDAAAGDTGWRPVAGFGPAWGLHLFDVNLALGNLVDLVHVQAAAHTADRPRPELVVVRNVRAP